MSPNRPQARKSTKGAETRKEVGKTTPPPKAVRSRGAREELRRERDEVVESRRIHRAVKDEFEEAQSRGLGVDEGIRRIDVHTSESPILSGGDIDADWKRADVGEETVGGTVSTPDQDVVDELGEAAGVEYADNEPLDPEEKILRRDRERWELNPASSEAFQENQRERDEELEMAPRKSAGMRGAAKTQVKPASAKGAPSKPASAKGAKGKPASTKPAGKRTQPPGRGKQR
jgi:hypothetical protein